MKVVDSGLIHMIHMTVKPLCTMYKTAETENSYEENDQENRCVLIVSGKDQLLLNFLLRNVTNRPMVFIVLLHVERDQ